MAIDRALVLPYIETIPQGEDIVIEDQPPEQLIKEKKKQGDKLPPLKIIVTVSVNPVPIVPVGQVRLMSSKSATPALLVHFPRNVLQGADAGIIKVGSPQTYNFLL